MTRSQEIAWLAGLLEGEGCFDALHNSNPRHRSRLRVRLKMTDRDVLERAHFVIPSNGSINEDKFYAHRPKYKRQWGLAWNGTQAEAVMRAVLPFMGQRRAAKIRECLATPNLSHQPKVTV